MNFAFPALFVVLLVLPGITLRYSYLRGGWRNSPFFPGTLTEELPYSLASACAVHFACIPVAHWFAHQFFHRQVDLKAALVLLLGSSGNSATQMQSAVSAATEAPHLVMLYFLFTGAFAAVVGWSAHQVVRRLKLDRKNPFFRFRNDWYYLMSGEIREFAEYGGQTSEMEGVYLSAIVEQGKESYLYRGILSEFYFSKTGELESVLLESAHRRKLSADRSSTDSGQPTKDSRYYDIRGDYFVLRYADMTTVNIEYIEKRTQDAQAPTLPVTPPTTESIPETVPAPPANVSKVRRIRVRRRSYRPRSHPRKHSNP